MPPGPQLPRRLGQLLLLVAALLVPWTLWLTFSLPSRHVSDHYDVAWVGFDVALAVAVGATGWAGVRRSRWLPVFAAVTGTMLVCDAWFDVVTSHGGHEAVEAAVEAAIGEVPLAALCAYVVYDVERFHSTVDRLRRPTAGARRAAARAFEAGARPERPGARARRTPPG
ncbi:MAG: hypothetical protein JOY72_07005 [Actinobacteria bacterium]|nr:hypothetical protein [Actinomycetota bacterium]